MKLTTARARTGCRTIFLIGILAIAGFIGGKRATVVSRILILNTRLVCHHRIARGIKGLAIEQGIKRGRTGPT